MSNRDYYRILGIHHEANEQEIKDAYRELVRLHHPDSGSRALDKDAESNTDLFKAITEAYATLINPEKRKLYDYEHGEINPESSVHWLKKKPAEEKETRIERSRSGGAARKMPRMNPQANEKVRLVLICTMGALFGILCALLVFAFMKLLN